MIPRWNQFCFLLSKDYKFLLCRMVRPLGCIAMTNKLSLRAKRETIWRESKGRYKSVRPMVYNACKKAGLNHAGYTILDGMSDPLFSPSAMWEAVDMQLEYSGMKVENLYLFMMSTLPGEEALKGEKICTLCNLSSTTVCISWIILTLMQGVGCYSPTKELLMYDVEKEENMACSRALTAMYVRLHHVAVAS